MGVVDALGNLVSNNLHDALAFCGSESWTIGWDCDVMRCDGKGGQRKKECGLFLERG